MGVGGATTGAGCCCWALWAAATRPPSRPCGVSSAGSGSSGCASRRGTSTSGTTIASRTGVSTPSGNHGRNVVRLPTVRRAEAVRPETARTSGYTPRRPRPSSDTGTESVVVRLEPAARTSSRATVVAVRATATPTPESAAASELRVLIREPTPTPTRSERTGSSPSLRSRSRTVSVSPRAGARGSRAESTTATGGSPARKVALGAAGPAAAGPAARSAAAGPAERPPSTAASSRAGSAARLTRCG